MNKAMRRDFMVNHDVMPSRQRAWQVTGRVWPATVATTEVTSLLKSNRFVAHAQQKAWARPEALPANIFDHVEVWERDGKVVMVTTHVYEGPVKIEAARAWAIANDVGFTEQPPSSSWHNSDAEAGTALFTFTRKV